MNYQKKYLKYKAKILQRGGADCMYINQVPLLPLDREMMRKYANIVFQPVCPVTSFSQHEGECWNDAIQMIFCYADGIRDVVQKKLFNLSASDIYRMALFTDRLKYLPLCYRKGNGGINFPLKIQTYIKLLQHRLCSHYPDQNSVPKLCEMIYDDEKILEFADHNERFLIYAGLMEDPDQQPESASAHPQQSASAQQPESASAHPQQPESASAHPQQPESASAHPQQPELANQPIDQVNNDPLPDLRRHLSTIAGVGSAIAGLDVMQMLNPKASYKEHGGTTLDIIVMVNILSCLFLKDNEMVIARVKLTVDLMIDDVYNSLAMICISNDASGAGGGKHATAFFKCSDRNIYYDDNNEKVESFDWQNFLYFFIQENGAYDIILITGSGLKPILKNKKTGKFFSLGRKQGKKFDELFEFDVSKYDVENILIIHSLIVLAKHTIDACKNGAIIPPRLTNQFITAEIINRQPDNIVEYVAKNPDIMNMESFYGMSLLKILYAVDFIEAVIALYEAMDTGRFPEAVAGKFTESAGLIIPHMIQGNKKNIYFERLLKSNNRYLSIPDATGQLPVFAAIDAGQPSLVRLFHVYEPNALKQLHNGMTPILYAVHQVLASADGRQKKINVVKMIISLSLSEINSRDLSGNVPLMLSIQANDMELFDMLLGSGAAISIKNNLGQSPAMAVLDAANINPAMCRALYTLYKSKINTVIDQGMTALEYAFNRGNVPAVQTLYEFKDLSARSIDIQKILQHFTNNGTDVNDEKITLLKGLMARGADINQRFAEGKTLIMQVAERGEDAMVGLLLTLGADPNLVDDDGSSAAQLAKSNNHLSTAKMLDADDRYSWNPSRLLWGGVRD